MRLTIGTDIENVFITPLLLAFDLRHLLVNHGLQISLGLCKSQCIWYGRLVSTLNLSFTSSDVETVTVNLEALHIWCLRVILFRSCWLLEHTVKWQVSIDDNLRMTSILESIGLHAFIGRKLYISLFLFEEGHLSFVDFY